MQELDHSFDVQGLNLIKSIFNIQQTSPGKGKECAVCGHLVSVSYMITTEKDIILENKTNTIQIGSRNEIAALENIVAGMKVGETRRALSRGEYAYDPKAFRRDDINVGERVKITATLLDISPKVFITPQEVKIYDDKLDYKMPILCGDKINFHLNVKKFDGTEVFNSKKSKAITMQVGDIRYPLLFGYALQGKIPTGKRMVIAPGKYLYGISGKAPHSMFQEQAIAKGEHFMIEFSDIRILQD